MARPTLPAAALLLAVLAIGASAEVCNIKVVTDASPDYSDMDSLIRSITGKWPTTKEKCWALFYWNHIARRQTSPMHLHGLALTDPIRQFNDYGYTMCSTIAGINCSIWDAMGLKTKYWDISLHTVSEVFYDGRWHIYDNSMSALYTLCDGKTIAGVEDVGKQGACAASGGRREPGHIARYHCLTATSKRGVLTGADCTRSLDSEYRCFNPRALKYRYYFYDWDRGHRYILNLRPCEFYTRNYKSLGTSPEYYVPNNSKDPESVNRRYRIRGNGFWEFKPALTPPTFLKTVHSMRNVRVIEPAGIEPIKAGEVGEVVFKVQGANVITSMTISAVLHRKTNEDLAAIAISTTNGLAWKEVWRGDKLDAAGAQVKLIGPVNGAYEVLVKVSLLGKAAPANARLEYICFWTNTMLNSKTQPKLLLGKNTVYVGLGEKTSSIVIWPDLQGNAYKPYVVEESNIATADKHPGYQGVLYAAKPNEEGYVVFKVDAPTDITRITYGGRLYNRAPKAHIDFLHSFDGGKTWTTTYSLADTKPPWDVIHYENVEEIPPGTRSLLFKYLLAASAAGRDACSIYAVRMEVNHRPVAPGSYPFDVTFRWLEVQKDRTVRGRSHTQPIDKVPCRYVINVGGFDHPIMDSLTISARGAILDLNRGYSDGKDVGGEKFVHRWVTYGTNLAEGKPYTVSVPSLTNWGAGDPTGKKLTDGVVGPPYAGGTTPRFGLCWKKGQKPVVTVDLGKPEACGAFRVHITAGWPWWDALKGQVKDRVEVLTSLDGRAYASQGFFDFDLRWKDIPINHMMPDDEQATGYVFALIPPKSVQARYVRFAITPERILSVSEVQVLDFIRYEPFDLRIALPDDKVVEAPKPPAIAKKQRIACELTAARTTTPPKVDGLLDEVAWKATGYAVSRLANGERAKGKARVLVTQDDKALYVAVERFEDPATLASLVAKVGQHDGDEIWADDDVELFLDPTGQRKSYYQIIVNSRGVTWDAWHDEPNHPDKGWEPKYRVATRVGPRSWVAELALPWAIFDRTVKSQPDWAFNVLCARQRAGEVVYWAPVLNTTAHTPENFGTLRGILHTIANPNATRKRAARPAAPPATVKTLFDFEDEAELKNWANLALGEGQIGPWIAPSAFTASLVRPRNQP